MYFWACWFNRRYRLIAYLALTLVLVVLAALPAGFERYQGHWAVVRITSPEHLAWVWNTGIGNTMAAMLVALVFIAADLGALGLGDDPERGNLDFLLSRPRFRAQLVWSGWFAGLTQLLPLLVLPLLTCLGVLAALTHTLRPGNLLRLSVPLFAMAAAMYTLAFFMATVARSARHGYELAALAVVLFLGYRLILSGEGVVYWLWSTDWIWKCLHGAFDWYLSPHQVFPSANLLFVVGAILFLPYLAQLSFARRDL
ncbi:MAG: ABC transporter permease subunit [Terriglobia bacterium]|jgi:ABC-type transport system involved in multi-copper enzyme maturation permease subunit